MPQTKNANPHNGNNFDDFLLAEGPLDQSTTAAVELVIAWLELHPIRTEEDLRTIRWIVSQLVEIQPEAGTPEADRLDALLALVNAYEREHPQARSPTN